MNEIKCKFEFECPKKWDALELTNDGEVRFCKSCDKNVYRVTTESEFNEYAARGDCVALDLVEYATLGRPEGVPYVEYSLFIYKQKITGKKLFAIREAFAPRSSLSEARLSYNMKQVKREDISKQQAIDLEKTLKEVGIDCEIQTRTS